MGQSECGVPQNQHHPPQIHICRSIFSETFYTYMYVHIQQKMLGCHTASDCNLQVCKPACFSGSCYPQFSAHWTVIDSKQRP